MATNIISQFAQVLAYAIDLPGLLVEVTVSANLIN
jgi:hypothetical protein